MAVACLSGVEADSWFQGQAPIRGKGRERRDAPRQGMQSVFGGV
jgi:hypothetical protein